MIPPLSRSRAISLVLAALALSATASAGTISVPGDYATIAEAVAAAVSGDTINVGPGTHVAIDIDFGGKNLKLFGDGADTTTLDAQSSSRHLVFENGEDSSARVRGFTLINGRSVKGGSIKVNGASPRIEECVFRNNVTRALSNGSGGNGGAVSLNNSAARVSDCVFLDNVAADGTQPASGTGERGGHGGALAIEDSSCEVLRCSFDGNAAGNGSSGAASGGAGGEGGNGSAVWLKNTESVVSVTHFEDCVFENSISGLGGPGIDAEQGPGGDGGLVYVFTGSADRVTFDGCVARNGAASGGSSPGRGGGFYLRVGGSGGTGDHAISIVNSALVDCSVDSGSSGGGVFANVQASTIGITHVTMSGCSAGNGGAVFANSAGLSLLNSIVWNSGIAPLSGVDAEYCNVEGGYPGAFNIDSDPLLEADGIHLQEGSPCVGTGSPLLEVLPTDDFDDDPRGSFGFPDMGADELSSVVRVPGDYGGLSIKNAVALVAPGGRVLVAPGTYNEWGINFQGKQLELVSEAGPAQTTIDAQYNGRHFTFTNGEGPTTLLEGFTLLCGNSEGNSGGSIRIADAAPTLRNLVIEDSRSSGAGHHGGALSVRNTPDETTCLIESCLFAHNYTASPGPGVNGGAVWANNARVVFKDCEFDNNRVSGTQQAKFGGITAPGKGGAVFATGSGPLLFEDCKFRLNSGGSGYIPGPLPVSHSGHGGALYIGAGSDDVTIERCIFEYNRAGNVGDYYDYTSEVFSDGGSIYYNDSGNSGRLVIRSSFFLGGVARRGADVYINGPSLVDGANAIVNTTFRSSAAIESGAAVFGQGARIDITNCIVWPNTSVTALQKSGGGSLTVNYSAISEPYSGTGNIFDQPLFKTSGSHVLHSDSPCIDAGDGSVIDLPAIDLDGHPVGCTPVDMGADETGFAAQQFIRAGATWPNPKAFKLGSSPPIQGSVWNPYVNHNSFVPAAVVDFVGISVGSIEIPYSTGSLLIDPTSLLPVQYAAPGEPFLIPIPTSCSLVGATLYSQAGSVGPLGEIELANGIDLVLGEQ